MYLWSPEDYKLGDITIIRVGDEYHLFSEVWRRDVTAETICGTRQIIHAVSRDLMEWEELPVAIGCGEAGEFDAYCLYHMDVVVHEGTWYMYYTGLDIIGHGQQQAIGLATSADGITWVKHPENPVLRADPRWYEPAIPPEACYQDKDLGRLWFRDPCLIQDRETGEFGMVVIARDKRVHPDDRACLAWATSSDLVHWKAKPPIYSPGRFHTIETPSIFEHEGRHYVVFMGHRDWGGPVLATDPYQDCGDFYAVSTNGWEGPYEQPDDEVLLAAHRQLRVGASRLVKTADGQHYFYGWLNLVPGPDDDARPLDADKVMPPLRPVAFGDEGALHIRYNPAIERWTEPQSGGLANWSGKALRNRRIELGSQALDDCQVNARIHLLRGERAGLVLRSDETASSGWQVIADRRYGRVEFGLLGQPAFIDARQILIPETFTLRVIAYGVTIEVYLDDRLLMHNVRHREQSGRLGWLVDMAEAEFELLDVQRFVQ